jgi:phosphatidylinositol glycan class Q protein
MGTNNGLMRIFWPSDAPTGPSAGVLVGFRNSELDVFVVSVLQEVEVRADRTMEESWLTWHSFVKSIMRW